MNSKDERGPETEVGLSDHFLLSSKECIFQTLKDMPVIQTLSMSPNTKHLLWSVIYFLFLANCPDVSKYPVVLPAITQTTLCLCHILLRYHGNRAGLSRKFSKTEPRAETLTNSLYSRDCLQNVAQRWIQKTHLRCAKSLTPSCSRSSLVCVLLLITWLWDGAPALLFQSFSARLEDQPPNFSSTLNL